MIIYIYIYLFIYLFIYFYPTEYGVVCFSDVPAFITRDYVFHGFPQPAQTNSLI
jgi:hypothetical protein